MLHHLALVEHGADYGVVFPDCPGCVAQAATFAQAVENATEALREWMADRIADGFPPPRPRTIAELRSDPILADDFAADPVVTSVPLLDAGRHSEADMALDAGLIEQIDAAAESRGLTRSAFLASAAREKIAAGR